MKFSVSVTSEDIQNSWLMYLKPNFVGAFSKCSPAALALAREVVPFVEGISSIRVGTKEARIYGLQDSSVTGFKEFLGSVPLPENCAEFEHRILHLFLDVPSDGFFGRPLSSEMPELGDLGPFSFEFDVSDFLSKKD